MIPRQLRTGDRQATFGALFLNSIDDHKFDNDNVHHLRDLDICFERKTVQFLTNESASNLKSSSSALSIPFNIRGESYSSKTLVWDVFIRAFSHREQQFAYLENAKCNVKNILALYHVHIRASKNTFKGDGIRRQ